MKTVPLLIAAAVLSGLGAAAAQVGAGQEAKPARPPDEPKVTQTHPQEKGLWWKDPRLDVKLTFRRVGPRRQWSTPLFERVQQDGDQPPEIMPLRPVRAVGARLIEAHEVSELARKQASVTLLIQGSIAADRLIVPLGEMDAREFMDLAADAFNARWYPVRDAWVLATSLAEAQLVALTREQRQQRSIQSSQALFSNFSPQQLATLAEGKQLRMPDLNRAQQEAIRTKLELTYYDPNSDWESSPTPRISMWCPASSCPCPIRMSV
ncbi:MAG TPA: hypothetical protein VFU47_13085, partial [Armatimonadota bacterium]|nr:hypothetical protein [Armatimonadota bacterium]